MIGIVLDCSVTMAWCFEDECDDYAASVLESLTDEHALAPSIWRLEVANVLLGAEGHKRLKRSDSARFLDLLGALPIDVELESAGRIWGTVLDVGRQFQLSSYDASYLELAMRSGARLATRDSGLRDAAERSGVELFLAGQ